MDDITSKDLRSASDEALLLIGRNLLIYQRIEMNLKWIEGNGRPIIFRKTTTATSLAEQIHANHDEVRLNTLGAVLKRVFRFSESQAGPEPDADTEFRMVYSSSFALEDTADAREWFDGWYGALVGPRNRLAHSFHDAFNLETVESCTAACRQLEEEHDTALCFLHFTRSVIASRQQGALIMSEFLSSDAFTQYLTEMTSLESFAHVLEQEARRLRRADGWCVFATAAHAIRASQPDIAVQLLAPGNYKTMRAAAEATQAFQWREEPTPKGSRLLFRSLTG